MGFPSITGLNIGQILNNILPPILRQPKNMNYLSCLAGDITTLESQVRSNILAGNLYSAWSGSTNYVITNRVTVGLITYECILTPSTGLFPPVLNTTYWLPINTDNIGLNERLNYNCGLLQLQYVLNKRFNFTQTGWAGTSILPPYNNTVPNIYIVTNPSYPPILFSSPNGYQTTYTAPKGASQFWFCPPNGFTTVGLYNYTIYVPSALASAMTTNYGSSYIGIITSEVNKYNAAGLTFNITTY